MVIVSSTSINVDIDTLKKYYDDFKNQFLDENGQLLPFDSAQDRVLEHYKNSQAEKESLKEYISLRKGENKKAQTLTIYEGDSNFEVELINALSLAKEQETLKPLATKDGFATLKILRIIPSEPKTYENAKQDAITDFTQLKKVQLLDY